MNEDRNHMKGRYGTGERLQMKADTPEQEATLTAWWLHIPGAHPLWEDYVLSCTHLRDIPGIPKVQKDFIGATHQLMVVPMKKAPEIKDGPFPGYKIRIPPNMSIQFRVTFDKGAIEVADALARAALDGCPWIEPKGIPNAMQAWALSITLTAKHYSLELTKPKTGCPKCGAMLYNRPDGGKGCTETACDYEVMPDGKGSV